MSRIIEPHLGGCYSRYGIVDQITLCKVISGIYKGPHATHSVSIDSTLSYANLFSLLLTVYDLQNVILCLTTRKLGFISPVVGLLVYTKVHLVVHSCKREGIKAKSMLCEEQYYRLQ